MFLNPIHMSHLGPIKTCFAGFRPFSQGPARMGAHVLAPFCMANCFFISMQCLQTSSSTLAFLLHFCAAPSSRLNAKLSPDCTHAQLQPRNHAPAPFNCMQHVGPAVLARSRSVSSLPPCKQSKAMAPPPGPYSSTSTLALMAPPPL